MTTKWPQAGIPEEIESSLTDKYLQRIECAGEPLSSLTRGSSATRKIFCFFFLFIPTSIRNLAFVYRVAQLGWDAGPFTVKLRRIVQISVARLVVNPLASQHISPVREAPYN